MDREPERRPQGRDHRVDAARYRVDGDVPSDDAPRDTRTAAEMRAWARTAIDLAIARGEFDDLPLAGKPLPGLAAGTVDPDWWLRGLIEREGLTGLAPPALSLRAESTGLHAELDRLRSEAAVRSHLDDFNARIVEARRQLSGGPPVVTPTRDVDGEVLLWHERRQARRAAEAAAVPPPPPSWRERRALRRELKRRRGVPGPSTEQGDPHSPDESSPA
ncbi:MULTISPECIES: DUF1992 domain-containing protein [unclassified Frigoribacterium]|jgi:hypothetical protein|uniref:DnaJ family domain-containing protein n=1 Tax=unclassified Frigoribacterium TaxID=2627005 RepID=UPI0009E2690E|nr:MULTISPECIES: DUF1992 domain-containing protein [unclassified Frigoribacterium]MBD8537462.1 DUF1992 domain-containing protein [Frigoribacterium sp. CFBP 8751]